MDGKSRPAMRRGLEGIGMTSRRTRDRLARTLESEGIENQLILETIRSVPRHLFVDEALASRAYENTALPIGHGQTISQPYVVARMTEALVEGRKLGKTLEIGTGCGYQTVVLSRLVGTVYSVERIPSLYRKARERISTLGVGNVRLRVGDGLKGWSQHAPYDGIIVTAAPASVPAALLEQLALSGRLVIPVGAGHVQRLLLIERSEVGYDEHLLEHVNFVPMLAGMG